MGVVQPKSGTIRHNGEEIQHLSAHELAQRAIQLVPEERRIFGSITVHANLQLAAMTPKHPQSIEALYKTYPRLEERRPNRGKQLSGVEQQMLAIPRAMLRHAYI